MASAEQIQAPETVVDQDAKLGVRRLFTIPGRDPFAEIEWEIRDAHIPGKDKPAFEQKDVEFPKFWSQTATNIVAQKYFRGRQCSACFILSIDDSMESILDWIRREGVIFRGGSGSGVNLSTLRSSKEQLSKGGYASGPVSFMRGADASAGTIKSGGKTRRAAKMVVLDVDHPDVEEFIWCKAKEERKARVLEQAGYDMSLDSSDWASIQYQNANNAVRVSDAFMEAAVEGKEWNLTARTDGTVLDTKDARTLLREMAQAA